LNKEIKHLTCEFADNNLIQELYGPSNTHLEQLEERFDVVLHTLGNKIVIEGSKNAANKAYKTLSNLYRRLEQGHHINSHDVDGEARLSNYKRKSKFSNDELSIVTRKRHVRPRSIGQASFIEALNKYSMVIALGPAGTGKTYIAVAKAVEAKLTGKVERIILSRPAVEAGERLGYLPGDMRDKIDPYLRPLYDAIYDMIPRNQVTNLLASGEIEIAPLAFMRGRTLSNAFIILDEAQNTTPMQMKMFLTRMGENSRSVVTGDLSQVDLPPGVKSGINDALGILKKINEIGHITFSHEDVVRHGLVEKIVSGYDSRDNESSNKTEKEYRIKD